ncbi:MAG: hypothetical protein DRO96_01485 [Candidatus Aenigmatarchaeota archaeon]|nr:MAG: hypothetical protein DRO96_01485 [Candidatus Aenigmarchaeota archaeon]
MFDKNKTERMSLEFVILQALNETQIVSKINLCLFVIRVLEKKNLASTELLKMKKELLMVLKDEKKYRGINLRDALLKEESLAYFGKDYGTQDELGYKTDTEEIIHKLNMTLIDAFALAYVETTGKAGGSVDLDSVETGEYR